MTVAPLTASRASGERECHTRVSRQPGSFTLHGEHELQNIFSKGATILQATKMEVDIAAEADEAEENAEEGVDSEARPELEDISIDLYL